LRAVFILLPILLAIRLNSLDIFSRMCKYKTNNYPFSQDEVFYVNQLLPLRIKKYHVPHYFVDKQLLLIVDAKGTIYQV